MNTLHRNGMVPMPHRYDGPTTAQKAKAIVILVAASAAFVVMILWPVVTRLA